MRTSFLLLLSPPALSHPYSVRVCDPTTPDPDYLQVLPSSAHIAGWVEGTLRPQGAKGQISLLLAIVSESEIPGTHPAAARGRWKGHAMILVL